MHSWKWTSVHVVKMKNFSLHDLVIITLRVALRGVSERCITWRTDVIEHLPAGRCGKGRTPSWNSSWTCKRTQIWNWLTVQLTEKRELTVQLTENRRADKMHATYGCNLRRRGSWQCNLRRTDGLNKCMQHMENRRADTVQLTENRRAD